MAGPPALAKLVIAFPPVAHHAETGDVGYNTRANT